MVMRIMEYVVNMHELSLTAPQHPRKAVINTIAPRTMDKIGAIPKSPGINLVTSAMLSLNSIPTMTNPNPINAKSKLARNTKYLTSPLAQPMFPYVVKQNIKKNTK